MGGSANPQDQITEENRKKGLFDMLNPFSGGGGGFGGIFQMLIFAVIAYVAARSETVQGWLNKLSDGLGDTVHGKIGQLEMWVKSLFKDGELSNEDRTKAFNDFDYETIKKHAGDKLPATIMNDATTYNTFKATVQEANGGPLTDIDSQMMSANTIFALATKQPQIMKGILQDFTKASSTMSDEQKAQAGKLMGSLKEIINSDKLDVLLNAQNRKNTLDMLSALVPPEKGKTPAQQRAGLEQLITANMVNGKPSPMLRAGLASTLDQMATDKGISVEASAGEPSNGAAMGAMSKTVMLQMGTELMGAENKNAVTKLQERLGDNFPAFAEALGSGDQNKLAVACNAPANKEAVAKFVEAVDSTKVREDYQPAILMLRDVAKDKQFQKAQTNLAVKNVSAFQVGELFTFNGQAPSAAHIMYSLMKANVRQSIRDMGTENVAGVLAGSAPKLKSVLTGPNLTVIMDTMGKISNNTMRVINKNTKEDIMPEIVGALVELAANNPEPMKQMEQYHPGAIALFFNNATNRDAMGYMVRNLKISGPKGKILSALRSEWGTPQDGIVEVLMDKESVEQLMVKLNNGVVDDWADKMVENRGHLEHLMNTIAEVKADTHLAPNVPPGKIIKNSIKVQRG